MRGAIAVLAAAALAGGCGEDDGRDAAAGRTDTEPVASVPEPREQLAMRCDTEAVDAPGLGSLVADGVDCAEAESVLLNWLQGCGGQESPCEPVPGYSCTQKRFAGAGSEVECVSGAEAVRFSFV